MANRSSAELPGPPWSAAHLRRRLAAEGFSGELPAVAWFGDTPEQANRLAELVRRGAKRATAGLLWRWQAEGGPPKIGDRQVIIDWHSQPQAVVEMTEVRIVPFAEVDAEFARAEGEGDLSLAYWRRVHWEFFARECARLGREPGGTMPVVCMRFHLIHPRSP